MIVFKTIPQFPLLHFALFTRQLLNRYSDIYRTEHDRLHFTPLQKLMDGIEVKLRIDLSDVRAGVHIVQNFPPYMRNFISQFFRNSELYKKRNPIAWNKIKISWKLSLDVRPTKVLRAIVAGSFGLTGPPSRRKH